MRTWLTILALLTVASPVAAATTLVAPNVYRVDAGVEFVLGNIGLSDYTFTWTDASGTYSNVVDPTLILVIGETYEFRRATSAHPFVITDDTLPVTGSDGSYVRATTDGSVIDAATLQPIADFTADPAPTSDFISWTTAAVGNFFYTCRVTGHTGMTGRIEVIDGAVSNEVGSFGAIKSLYND